MLLFLGLRAELQVDVVGELGEVAEALLPAAHAVSRKPCGHGAHARRETRQEKG